MLEIITGMKYILVFIYIYISFHTTDGFNVNKDIYFLSVLRLHSLLVPTSNGGCNGGSGETCPGHTTPFGDKFIYFFYMFYCPQTVLQPSKFHVEDSTPLPPTKFEKPWIQLRLFSSVGKINDST